MKAIRPKIRRTTTLLVLGALLTMSAALEAFAAPAPTVHLGDGGDGYINAAEAGAVVVDGTYTPTDGSVTHVRATVSVAIDAACSVTGSEGVDFLTPVNVPVDGTSGTWSTTFDVNPLPEAATLCARAVSFDGAYGPVAGSPEQAVLDTTVPSGTVSFDDANGLINGAEASAGSPVSWSGSADATASLSFSDAADVVPGSCGPFPGAASGSDVMTATCAGELPDGTIKFRGTWADAAGNVSTEAIDTATLDTGGPAEGIVELLDPNGDGYLNLAEATTSCCIPANWTNTNLDVVSTTLWFEDNNGDITAACGPFDGRPPSGTGDVNAGCAASMAQGEFGFFGTWLDAAGNTSVEVFDALIKDTIVPAVTLTEPATGSTVGSHVLVRGTTEPTTAMTYKVDGIVVATGASDADGDFEQTLTLTDGAHTIEALAHDAASNPGSATVSVTVDGLIPVIDRPIGGSLNPSVVVINGTGRPGSKVEVFEGTTIVAQAQVSATGSWTAQSGMTTGSHTIRARGVAFGGAPVSAFGPDRSFLVDGGRPGVVISTDDMSVFPLSQAVIDGTANDGSAVARIRLEYFDAIRGAKLASHDATCTGCGTGSATWTDEPALPPGLITVQATAFDDGGNPSSTAAIRFLNANV